MSNYNNSTNNAPNVNLSPNAVPVVGASGVLSSVGPLTDGQLIIGSTGSAPVAAVLTQGTNISISNGAGSITISSTTGGTTWNGVTGTSQACIKANGYFSNNAAATTMYMPGTAAVGDEVKLSNNSSAMIKIMPQSGQTVNLLTSTATFPASLKSTSAFAAADLVCSAANTTWSVVNNEGTFTVDSPLFMGGASAGDTYFLKSDGTAWSCGLNTAGQLGNQTVTSYSSPISVVGAHTFSFLKSSTSFNGALKATGTAWTWGINTYGQLGNNTRTSYSSPVSVVGAHSFVQLAAGINHTVGLKTGSCWSWGGNTYGQVGNQTTTSYSSPVSVVGAHTFTNVTCCATSTFGLKADGTLWAWGDNTAGQLGNQSVTSYSSPISVIGAHSFISISGGTSHILALKADGTAWAWGINSAGQLGNQTLTSYSSPIAVIGAHSFIQIAAGDGSSYGLKADGTVWGWGDNASGQLGNFSAGNSYSSPVAAVGSNSFYKLVGTATDTTHMMAWTANGEMFGWGLNTSGELGNQTTTTASSPVLVVNTP